MAGLELRYFVLKPAGNSRHAEASRKAMRAYANHMAIEGNEEFCKDLRAWVDREEEKAFQEKLDDHGA